MGNNSKLLAGSVPGDTNMPGNCASAALLTGCGSRRSIRRLFSGYNSRVTYMVIRPYTTGVNIIPPRGKFLGFLHRVARGCNSLLVFSRMVANFELSLNNTRGLCKMGPSLAALKGVINNKVPLTICKNQGRVVRYITPLNSICRTNALSKGPMTMDTNVTALGVLRGGGSSVCPRLRHGSTGVRGTVGGTKLGIGHINSVVATFFASGGIISCSATAATSAGECTRCCGRLLRGKVCTTPSRFRTVFISFTRARSSVRGAYRIVRDFGWGRVGRRGPPVFVSITFYLWSVEYDASRYYIRFRYF